MQQTFSSGVGTGVGFTAPQFGSATRDALQQSWQREQQQEQQAMQQQGMGIGTANQSGIGDSIPVIKAMVGPQGQGYREIVAEGPTSPMHQKVTPSPFAYSKLETAASKIEMAAKLLQEARADAYQQAIDKVRRAQLDLLPYQNRYDSLLNEVRQAENELQMLRSQYEHANNALIEARNRCDAAATGPLESALAVKQRELAEANILQSQPSLADIDRQIDMLRNQQAQAQQQAQEVLQQFQLARTHLLELQQKQKTAPSAVKVTITTTDVAPQI